jgi:hypothetical protein
MWDFRNSKEFALIHHFTIPAIYTWGEKERDKREEIRRNASKNFPDSPKYEWYAFYIEVDRDSFERPLDIENVPKLIIDAFSSGIMEKDESSYRKIGLYSDDDLRHVRALQIEGKLNRNGTNTTEVWIFGKK